MTIARLAPRLLLPLLLSVITACTTLPGKQADIDAVMRASGMDAQIAWLNQPLGADTLGREKLEGPLALIPDEWIKTVNARIADSVQAENIRGQMHAALQKNLSAAELNAVQAFYESPAGLQIVAVESGKALTDSSGIQIINNDRATLDAMANASGYGQAVSQLAQSGLNEAVDIAVKNGCFGIDQYPFASMLVGVIKKSQLAALREGVNSRVRQRYARLSSEEQSAYLEFARSSAGRKFLDTRRQVMQDAAQRAGSHLSGDLADAVKTICKPAKS